MSPCAAPAALRRGHLAEDGEGKLAPARVALDLARAGHRRVHFRPTVRRSTCTSRPHQRRVIARDAPHARRLRRAEALLLLHHRALHGVRQRRNSAPRTLRSLPSHNSTTAGQAGKGSRSSEWSSALRRVVDGRLGDHPSLNSGRRRVSGPHQAKRCRGSARRWLDRRPARLRSEVQNRPARDSGPSAGHGGPDDGLEQISSRAVRRASGFCSLGLRTRGRSDAR
jgi:hypothetical protein